MTALRLLCWPLNLYVAWRAIAANLAAALRTHA